MKARLCDVETAESQLRLAAVRGHGKDTGGAVNALLLARDSLGSGPLKGPRIEARWKEVAGQYRALAEQLLPRILEALALPERSVEIPCIVIPRDDAANPYASDVDVSRLGDRVEIAFGAYPVAGCTLTPAAARTMAASLVDVAARLPEPVRARSVLRG